MYNVNKSKEDTALMKVGARYYDSMTECRYLETPPMGGGKPICGHSAHLSLVFAVFLILDRLRRRKDDV
jgi:hypothetical protein